MIRIALDAMGSDQAPATEVAGAVDVLTTLPSNVTIQLVGRERDIESALAGHPNADRSRVEVLDAADVIGMGEKPLAAIRSKPNSSLMVGMRLQKDRASDAFISAGNTGAVMAAGALVLGLHNGVQRPAIGTLLPTAKPDHPVLLLDSGANVDCSATELVGFAHLGTVYARDVLKRSHPAVGLLNIGEEAEKGNAVVKEAHQLLQSDSRIHFVGNVEGRDIPTGEGSAGPLDVVVCDGFVGNVILKFYETAARVMLAMIRDAVPNLFDRPEMEQVLRTLDWSEYGGAPLLGVRGVCIISHGSLPPRAVKNAIHVAVESVTSHLNQHIGAEFAHGEAAV